MKTYPEMNEEIKKILTAFGEPKMMYAAKRIEELEHEVERLRKALEDISESDHRNGYCGRVARRALAGEE